MRVSFINNRCKAVCRLHHVQTICLISALGVMGVFLSEFEFRIQLSVLILLSKIYAMV